MTPRIPEEFSARLIDWSPFVVEPNSVAIVQRIDFTDMGKSEIERALKDLPPDVRDFPGFVWDAIEKIEKAQSGKA